ncbi:hypothetical protein GCM10011611_27990 [Aliidongia dinghuensis]|uniref:CdiI immunity protein domain-containing protein n=1 Tax=Aliidongia dinghuensis TaxID=1867774 RepID=A0A8J2YTZ9_9PROT|nr:contact-dependent growth inhibition system immunity protein [Aliidongia dinghuensis]GGF20382.1 hypothetical protein GCM10011611_27990 [Aliidongia dinghuensis]
MGYSELQKQFFNLFTLLAGYLNQDFDIFGPDLDDAVNAFIDVSDAATIAETRAEIAHFLKTKANDLDAELERLSGGHAQEPGMSTHAYLLWLDGLLAEAQGRKDDA